MHLNHFSMILKIDQIVTIGISRNTDLNKAAQYYPKPEAAILLTVGSYRQLFLVYTNLRPV